MKFGQVLETQAEAEWREYYVQYAKLKKIIKTARDVKNGSITDQIVENEIKENPVLKATFQEFVDFDALNLIERNYWDLLISELNKVQEFYFKKVEEFQTRLKAEKKNFQLVKTSATQVFDRIRAKRRIRKAIREDYKAAHLVRNYCILNHTTFYKITKKYDKLLQRGYKSQTMEIIENSDFKKRLALEDYLTKLEQVYIDNFHNGNRKAGMQDLRDYGMRKIVTHHLESAFIGFMLGMNTIMLVFILFSIFSAPHSDVALRSNRGESVPSPFNAFPHFIAVWLMYRGLGLCFLMAVIFV